MKLLRSLTFRLAMFYAGLFALSVLLLGALFYILVIWVPLQAVRGEIAREAEQLAAIHEREGALALGEALDLRAARPAARLPYHALLAPSGETLTANLPSWPGDPGRDWTRIEADVAVEGDEEEHEALVHDMLLPDGSRLLVGRDIDTLDDLEEALTDTLVWLLPALLLLSLGGGAVMSREIGRRIDGVSTAARGVIAGDLAERVELRGTGDDFDQLGETLNVMLDRIEHGMDAVRRVSDSVAHELRTPLTRLRASLAELELRHDEQAVADAVEEAERLEAIFNAVLRIARIETAATTAPPATVDLAALLNDAMELYQPEAEARGQAIVADVAPGLTIPGDRDLLFQAMANLLDNAIKFSPEGGRISVRAEQSEGHVRVAIEDQGPGVPADIRDRITERFFRSSEAAQVPGAGLGLSLVAAVAALHEAPITFASAEPGLRVEWEFRQADG